ncbi:MAG: hypothetical protein PHP32_02650 [Candidatus Izemoplasmatales bacterium]|nr:hypothetical protein [Candidatus Izemoplasmatales bacterium]
MKKILLAAGIVLMTSLTWACNTTPPDYTIDEAFDLMNEAIQGYLDAESLSLEYAGSYTSTNYNNNEVMTVKMKNIGTDSLIGKVEMTIEEDGATFVSEIHYQDGWVYNARTQDGETQYGKTEEPNTTYESLYMSFLKSTIAREKVVNISLEVEKDFFNISFQLSSTVVESTLFVSNVLNTVNVAEVTLGVSHDGELMSIMVTYPATISGISGTEQYAVSILKLNQYVVIDQLSSTEVAQYTEQTNG